MIVFIQLTIAGADVGPFSLYSDTDGYITPFETGVLRETLVDGQLYSSVPDYTTVIRVQSTGVCTNYIDIPVGIPSTTTTSTSTSTTTSTSTSTTTTTTTSAPPPDYYAYCYYREFGHVSNACLLDPQLTGTLYGANPGIADGDVVYTDSGLTTPFNGENEFWKIEFVQSQGITYSIQIDINGGCSNKSSCGESTVCPPA